MYHEKSIKQIVRDFPLFRNLPDIDADVLLSAFVVREYQKNQLLFRKGDDADRAFIIISGWVKHYNVNGEGENGAMQLLTKGDVLGLDAIYLGGVYLYAAEAVNHCRLLEVPAVTLRERVRANPVLAENLLGILSYRIKEMQVAGACFLLGDSSRRLACLLLRLSSWMLGRGGTFRLPYEKSVAAAQLGMDQATLSRALSRLDALGAVSQNGEVSIGDFSRLSAHCCAHCPILEGQCPGRRGITGRENTQAPAH